MSVEALAVTSPASRRSGERYWRFPSGNGPQSVLRFYEDLSERETAELLRCRPGTVKSLVSRGMEGLRSSIDSGGEPK